MSVTLLFNKTRARIGSLELDACISETHTADVEVTDHPVERGASISDHARPEPEKITIEGLITNTPLPPENGALTRLSSGAVQFDSRTEMQPTRAHQTYEDLLVLKDSGELITVQTSLRTYENMVMTSLNVPRDARTGEALRFTATFKRVSVVTSRTAKVKVTENKAKGKVNLGKKAATPASEATARKSFAKHMKDTGVIQKALSRLERFLGTNQ